jgi:hypothetical protein
MRADEVHDTTRPTTAYLSSHNAVVAAPTGLDVLCGRGKYSAYPGNDRFHRIIATYKPAYLDARRREEKAQITEQATREILMTPRQGNGDGTTRTTILQEPSQNVRFLIRADTEDDDEDKWFTVTDDYIREKVSHALRSRPTEAKKRRLEAKRNADRPKPLATALPNVETIIESMIQEQQALLQTMMSEHVFLEGSSSSSSPAASAMAVLDTTDGATKVGIHHTKLRRCPMEKGLHTCHHLG